MDLIRFHPQFIGVFTNIYIIIESIYYFYKMRNFLEISDDFGAFWRYLEQAPEMTIEIENRSILESQNRSIHKSWCRSIVKRAEARLVTADLKPKISLFYKIFPDEFYPNYISFAAMLEAKCAFLFSYFQSKGFLGFQLIWREDPKRFVIEISLMSIYISMQFLYLIDVMNCLAMSEQFSCQILGFKQVRRDYPQLWIAEL